MLTFHVNVCYQLQVLVFTGFVLCGTYRYVTALTRACQEERRPPNIAGGGGDEAPVYLLPGFFFSR